jgi:NitT/TauT family transport system substrate-binding protein
VALARLAPHRRARRLASFRLIVLDHRKRLVDGSDRSQHRRLESPPGSAMLAHRVRFVRGLAAAIALSVLGAAAHAADKINVRFSWKLKGEYVAFYVAKEKGYFAAQNLDVSLGEGAGAQAALGALLQDQEDVVVVPGVYALTAISKGMPVKIVALYHPVAPVGFLSNPENPVPKDLEGKSVATASGDTTVEYLPILCKKNNIDCAKIRRVRGDVSLRVPMLQQKQVDIASTYLNVDPPILREQNINFVIFDASKYGLVVPGLSLVSSTKLIGAKGDALRRFIVALNQGFETSRADPPAAAAMLLKSWAGGPSQAVVTEQVKKTLEFTPTSREHPAGFIDPALIRSTLDEMVQLQQLDAPLRPLADYYTDALLPAAKQ